jgi:hypothetical protein
MAGDFMYDKHYIADREKVEKYKTELKTLVDEYDITPDDKKGDVFEKIYLKYSKMPISTGRGDVKDIDEFILGPDLVEKINEKENEKEKRNRSDSDETQCPKCGEGNSRCNCGKKKCDTCEDLTDFESFDKDVFEPMYYEYQDLLGIENRTEEEEKKMWKLKADLLDYDRRTHHSFQLEVKYPLMAGI